MNYPAGPDGGPLVGSGTKQLIAEAAIKADMEHRHFQSAGNGVFTRTITSGNDRTVTAYRLEVSDGKVDLVVTYPGSGNNPQPDLSEYQSLQSEVFDYWPDAIDQVFVGWEDMTTSTGLTSDAHVIESGASEIAVHANNKKGSLFPANARLGRDLTDLTTRTGDLNGRYAETFNENYVAGLPGVLDNLNSITEVLAYALAAEAGIFDKTREQIADVAVKALDAMEASGPESGGDTTALRLLLVVVGAAAAGVATFATAGGAAAVGGALLSAGAGAAGGAIGILTAKPAGDKPELPLQAGTPQGVLENMKQAFEKVNTAITTEETKVRDLLEAGLTDSGAQANPFDIARPEIIDHQGQSVLESGQLITVDDETIGKITELWIPTINGDVTACAGKLVGTASSWQRPASIGLGANGAWSSFSALQSSVQDHLINLRTEMSGAADSLLAAAALIGRSDDATNARLAQEAARINAGDIDTI